MSFSLDFDELPISIDGSEAGFYYGSVEIAGSGEIRSITLKDDRCPDGVELMPSDASPIKRALFSALSISIRKRMATRIVDAIYDYHRGLRADHQITAWKEARL